MPIADVNLHHLAPELSLTAVAILVILADLVVPRKGLLAWGTVAGLAVSALLVLSLWGRVESSFGGALVVDQFALFFKLLVLGTVLLVVLASQDYVSRFRSFVGEYYGLVLLAAVGMMLVAGTRELISIYLSLELTVFSIVALAAFLKDGRSAEAAIKYLLLSAIASAVMLYGMALIFGLTGSTKLTEIAAWIRGVDVTTLLDVGVLLVGFLFLLVGFGFKIATVPFQMWVPDVYEGAPTPVTAYLSVASKAAGFAILLRVFSVAFPDVQPDWQAPFALLATVSMFLGNLVAVAQSNIKRLLAYSTIAHAGYIMIGLAVANQTGQSAVLFYLVAYAFTNMGAFIAVIALANRAGSEEFSAFAGLGRVAPFPALVLALCLVSLTGVPPTAGFIGKVYIFSAAVQSGLVWLALVGVVNSVISAYYYWRVIRLLYTGAAPAATESVPASLPLRASLAIAFAGVLLLGLAPQQVISWATEAVGVLQAAAPLATPGL